MVGKGSGWANFPFPGGGRSTKVLSGGVQWIPGRGVEVGVEEADGVHSVAQQPKAVPQGDPGGGAPGTGWSVLLALAVWDVRMEPRKH